MARTQSGAMARAVTLLGTLLGTTALLAGCSGQAEQSGMAPPEPAEATSSAPEPRETASATGTSAGEADEAERLFAVLEAEGGELLGGIAGAGGGGGGEVRTRVQLPPQEEQSTVLTGRVVCLPAGVELTLTVNGSATDIECAGEDTIQYFAIEERTVRDDGYLQITADTGDRGEDFLWAAAVEIEGAPS
ncbi:hypothetical protein [Zhihengliuella sp.]|uniref:hypothetical protein n=1 Tax=Zhihengliuella sp. TaxID=1954483 RepID=UPI0028117594|nr:hypothetical protein [Zhihengliuella sp.]